MKNALKILPLLILYISIVLIFSSPELKHDEIRYIKFAANLSHGFYTTAEEKDLWNGPGYPLILLPFIVLKLPWILPRILNAFFLFGTTLYFYKTLRAYIKNRQALIFSYILGVYPPMIRHVHLLITESLTFFLIGGFLYYFCKLYRDRKGMPALIASSCFLGLLALTKIGFGYIIITVFILNLFLYLWKRSLEFKKTLLVYMLALLLCSPYLVYTYSLTGRFFYWGNAGGMSLYWLASPYEDNLGDWKDSESLIDNPQLAKNHEDFFNKISHLDFVQRDDELKKQAIYNIKHHPSKFFKNWVANISRMLFSYPYSYTPQKLSTLFYLIPNMFIWVFIVICIYPVIRGYRLIPYELHAMLLFIVVAFFGSSLLSAYPRMFAILVPVLACYVFFVLGRILKVSIETG